MAKQDDYVRITLRLPPDLHEALVRKAGANSLNAEIVSLLSAPEKTLRDEFAMAALTGMLSNGFQPNEAMISVLSSYDYDDQEKYKEDIAQNNYTALSYRIADAMLSARGVA